ncbi:MAG: flagellin [Bacteroidota bacterium]|nr:flagellin [Bacteroidota bacterium]
MPTSITGAARIMTNIPAENAYNALMKNSKEIARSQLRLATGKRINSAADDVSGYITVRSMNAKNGALKSALLSVGEALNVTSVAQDALDNISELMTEMKNAAASSSSGALGTDEKVALAKSAYRLAQQIQSVTDSTTFGGKQLLKGGFAAAWKIGYTADNTPIDINIDLTTSNNDLNIESLNFDLNAIEEDDAASASNGNGKKDDKVKKVKDFAGVKGLNLKKLDEVSSNDLGVFATSEIDLTLTSFADALNNVNKVASYVGGIQVRLESQEDLLNSQITNYKAAISRIEDTDFAEEQLKLIKSMFLQQAAIMAFTQANQAPENYLKLFGSSK